MLDGPINRQKAEVKSAGAGPDSTLVRTRNCTIGAHRSHQQPATDAKQPVLIIMHQERSNPGGIGQWLRAANYPLDIRRPALGDELPRTLHHHSGAIILGGPMSAFDNEPYLSIERQLIETALREHKPCLGVCLGAQLMAQVLGVEVRRDPQMRAEIGYYAIEPTTAGREICQSWPSCFYQWHRDGFDLPHGATLLAQAEGPFPNQAFSYDKTAIAIQFHPEITLALIHRWTTLAARRLSLPGARQPEQHFTGHLRFSSQVAKWRACFLDNWLNTAALEK